MVEWTKEQLKAIELRGKDILVSASAGSGKTTVMVERVLSLLNEGYSLKDMLIVTFTRAAAADMKEKLAGRLLKSEKEEVKNQLYLLGEVDISTLHSFCQRLIGSYFYYVGLDPEFTVCEEAEREAMLNQSVEEALEEEAVKAEDCFMELSAIFGDTRGDNRLKNLIKENFNAGELRAERVKNNTTEQEYKQLLLNELDDKREALFDNAAILENETYCAGFKRNFDAVSGFKDFILNKEYPVSPHGKIDPAFIQLNEDFKELKEQGCALIDDYNETERLKGGSEKYLEVLDRLTFRTKEIFTKLKHAKSKLDFNDLEHYALKILKSAAGEDLKSAYKFIFVDEYQDINPIQDEIITALKGNNYLFLVGDVKQSIYAFRGCDPLIFAQKYLDYKAGKENCEAIELNANHRSCDCILNFANQVFSAVMSQKFGSTDYKNSARFIVGKRPGGHVRFNLSDPPQEDENSCAFPVSPKGGATYSVIKPYDLTNHKAQKNMQAQMAASRIAEILTAEKIFENGRERPVLYKDIAVLTRGFTDTAASISICLNSLGIPAVFCGELRSSGTVTAALINYLKVIDNPLDDVALINSLKSLFGGFTDGELAEIRLANPKAEYFYEAYNNYPYEDLLKNKITAFNNTVEEYRRLGFKLSASALCGRIVSDFDYFQYLFGAGLNAAVLETFLQRAESFEGCLYEFIKYAESMGRERAEPLTDAVKIMTVHASKGLEFPYVLLIDAQKQFNLSDLHSPVLIYEGKPAIKYYDWDKRECVKSAAWLYNYKRLLIRQKEEEMRLLYVAVTRAKYCLDIFSEKQLKEHNKYAPYEACNSWLKWLSPFCEKYQSDKIAEAVPPVKGQRVFPRPDPQLVKALKEKFELDIKVNKDPPKTYVTDLSSGPYEFFNLPQSDFSGGEEAMEKGILFHKAMELIDFSADFDIQWQGLNENIKNVVNKQEIAACVSALTDLTSGKRCFKEQGFMVKLDEGESAYRGGIMVQGVIDLLILDDDGAVIVDYKTGNISPHYEKQLNYYALAVEKVLKIKVKKQLIYSFKQGRLINLK